MKKLLSILLFLIISNACFALSSRLNDPAYLKLYIRGNYNVDDYSGNGSHGTWAGTEAYGESLFGKGCLDFNGSSGITFSGGVSSQSNGFSVSGWVKVDSLLARRTIWVSSPDVSNGAQIRIETNGKVQVLLAGLALVAESVSSLVPGVYYHIAVTYSSADLVSFYINGSFDYSETDLRTFTFGNNKIGVRSTNQDYMLGCLSEIRGYETVLTLTEIRELYYMPYPQRVVAKQVASSPGIGEIIAPDSSLELLLTNGDRGMSKNDVAIVNNGCVIGNGVKFKTGSSITWDAVTLTSYSYWFEEASGYWKHYFYNGTLYINGVAGGSQPITVTTTGITQNDGLMKELRVWSEVKSSAYGSAYYDYTKKFY